MCLKPSLALGFRAEQALPHLSLLRQGSEPWDCHRAGRWTLFPWKSCSSWSLVVWYRFQQGQALKLCLLINFSCLCLPGYGSGDWTAICPCLLFPNHTNTHPGCCKHQKQPEELWSSLLPYRKTARGRKETALRQHLLVLAPHVQCWCEGSVPDWAICWRNSGKREINYFSDTSHIQAGSVSLTSLTSAVVLSLGAITRLFMSQGSVVASALQYRAVLCLGCSSPTPLPLNPHIYLFFFPPHTSKGERERNVNN